MRLKKKKEICVLVVFRVPDLESMPSGVTLRDPISIARDIPGASRSITSLVACREEREAEECDQRLN